MKMKMTRLTFAASWPARASSGLVEACKRSASARPPKPQARDWRAVRRVIIGKYSVLHHERSDWWRFDPHQSLRSWWGLAVNSHTENPRTQTASDKIAPTLTLALPPTPT